MSYYDLAIFIGDALNTTPDNIVKKFCKSIVDIENILYTVSSGKTIFITQYDAVMISEYWAIYSNTILSYEKIIDENGYPMNRTTLRKDLR